MLIYRLTGACLGLALGLGACRAMADDVAWAPVPVPAPAECGKTPIVKLLTPRPLEMPAPAPTAKAFYVVRAQNPDPFFGGPPGGPPAGFAGQPPPPPPYPAPGSTHIPGSDAEKNPYDFVSNSGGGPGILDQGKQAIGGLPEAIGIAGNGSRGLFQSDHCFDVFCSPVSNPFLMQDPRSLTEVKPLLLFQQIPHHSLAGGGDIWFYGLQGRLAVTDMFSVVINKLGFVTLDTHDPTKKVIPGGTGFAETMFGPQFTFIRNESSGTLLAAGLTFDVAWGSSRVFQNTGDLSLIPYLSFGQNFLKSSYGSFNFLTTSGYSFATDNKRNDFFYTSLHLDYDAANLHKIYPLLEFNWIEYTSNGHKPTIFGIGGGDLANLGSGGIAGHEELTMAVGARYKFTEWFQVGAVVEFPLVDRSRGLMDYRLQLDLIFRY